MTTASIKINGLREFQRELKALDGDLPKALRVAFNEAADLIADTARPRVPRRRGRARGSVKVRSTQKAARVAGGGSRAPYYPWLDFGGAVGRGRGQKRPFLKRGRYIYDAFYRRREAGDFQDALSRSLVKVARSAGIEVTT